MTISDERMDRFTFMPGQLTPITDPDELEAIYKTTGVRPVSDEEQEWIAEQWRLRYGSEPGLSTFKLQDEYHDLKAQGKL